MGIERVAVRLPGPAHQSFTSFTSFAGSPAATLPPTSAQLDMSLLMLEMDHRSMVASSSMLPCATAVNAAPARSGVTKGVLQGDCTGIVAAAAAPYLNTSTMMASAVSAVVAVVPVRSSEVIGLAFRPYWYRFPRSGAKPSLTTDLV